MRRLIYVAVVLMCCPLGALAQDGFPDVDTFLRSTFKGEARLSDRAVGDLNNDGLADWVGVIHGQEADASPTYQLFVLLQMPGGVYRIAVKTEKSEIAGMGCCWLEDLQIRRGSVYIQSNAKTASTMEAATHQFKLQDGQWRLISLRIYLTDHNPDAPRTIDTDVNLLTGRVIEKTQRGNRKPVVTSRRKKVETIFLKDFDFSNGFGFQA